MQLKSSLFSIAVLSCASACLAMGCKSRSFNAKQSSTGEPKSAAKPKFVVLLVVDQMRFDYLDRFAPLLRSGTNHDGGLLGLKTGGTWFANARAAAAPTVTAAGHTSICTGASPSVHGIVANSIYDVALKREIDTVGDPDTTYLRTTQPDAADPLASAPVEGASPKRLRIDALADVIQARSTENGGGEKARAVAISVKDRAAVFCGGQRPTGAYFHDPKIGEMVTSTYYGSKLPAWVDVYNKAHPTDTTKVWTPDFPTETYAASLDERNKKVFGVRSDISGFLGTKFPYRVVGGNKSQLTARKRFEFTPFASEKLTDFALAAIEGEKLGQRGAIDYLVVSFSSPDYVGHAYGSDSLELFDTYVKLNKTVEAFRVEVEKRLGQGNVLWALTADHGVQRMPEATSILTGRSVARLDAKKLKSLVITGLNEQLGQGEWVNLYSTDQLYLNHEFIQQKGLPLAQVVEAARGIIGKVEGVRMTLSREDILKAAGPEAAFYARGYDKERSGDVTVVVHEGWLGDSSIAGNHGSVHEDDARIPLAFAGWGVKKGVTVSTEVRADDIAPTLLDLVGYQRGDKMTGRSLKSDVANDSAR